MFLAYIIAAVVSYLLGGLAKTTPARFFGATLVGLLSLVVLSAVKIQVVSSAVSQVTGTPVVPDNPVDLMGAAIAVFAFWQGSKPPAKQKSEDAAA